MGCCAAVVTIAVAFLVAGCGACDACGQATAAASSQPSAANSQSAQTSDGLHDLDAMTFACSRAALNAAAREAARFPAQGTYQFSFFKIITGSHHARYEVHFESNDQDEPELKYCVVLYCQQGWDPASAQPSVALLGTSSTSAAAHPESCSEAASSTSGHGKSTASNSPQMRVQ